MSLLLEALKRAEDDSKKRRLAAAEARVPSPAFVNSSLKLSYSDSGDSDLELLDDRPAERPAISPESADASSLRIVDFVDIALDLPDASATIAKPIAPTVRSAVPPGAAASKPAATHRQAKLAASVMAGQPPGRANTAPKKRQAWLAIAAVLIALPVAAFFLFGDKLLGSSNTLLAQAPLPQSALPSASPVVSADPPLPVAAAVLMQPAAVSAPVTLTAPAVISAPAQALPAPRARTAASTRANQGDDVKRSTTIDLDRPASRSRAASPQQQIARKPPTTMESAYAAYTSGDSQEAARLYREVLKQDPTQRDAWLGLAVIAHNSNQREAAMDGYKRVLRLEPQNATALAGLTSLNNNADEPRQESRLRELLARSPQEADLNHSLALVLSGERRWSEAQQLFFKAHTLAPQEPQFAYNLAVTLDQLRKSTLAAQYYETALSLAQGKAASFDEVRARTRLATLRATSAGSPDIKTP